MNIPDLKEGDEVTLIGVPFLESLFRYEAKFIGKKGTVVFSEHCRQGRR